MPEDDPRPTSHPKGSNGADGKTKIESQTSPSEESPSLFSLPQPIKQIFDKFPLRTYAPNDLPSRGLKRRDRHALYVFATEDGARNGQPSYNPGCLKWQTCLCFSGVKHTLLPSNNHASPSGVLPFLIPAVSNNSTASSTPIPSNKLLKWIETQSTTPCTASSLPRAEAYTSLLDHRIRAAWLHALYLSPANAPIVTRLYIDSTTSSSVVRSALASQLQSAAYSELERLSPSATPSIISEEDIYTEARQAFEALSILLGQNDWFFGEKRPGLFDASVFAYTCLILDRSGFMSWKDKRLQTILDRHDNLKVHSDKILEQYYS